MNSQSSGRPESERVEALRSYNLLDSMPEADYEALTQLAAYICQTPVALISLVDADRQWFKSNRGLTFRETPRSLSFCAHTILDSGSPMVIEDARLDDRFSDNPLVTGDPHIVFYAGIPLVDEDGIALGSLCVIDSQVRQLNDDQLNALALLSKQVINLMTLRKVNQQLLISQRENQIEATEKEKTQIALVRSEDRFKHLIDQAPVATALFVGRDMRIELANKPMFSIWGKGESVIGKPLVEVLPELIDQPFLSILDEVFTTGKPYSATGAPANLVVDGVLNAYYFDFTYEPIRNPAGEVYAVMDMAIDVTEQVLVRQKIQESEARYRKLSEELEGRVQARTQELESANQDLKRSNDNLQQFAYIASHDLQEPLRKIQSFSELIKDQYSDQLGKEGVDLLNRMKVAGMRMSTLIKDLLAYSRIATRQQTFGPVSLNAIVANAINVLEWEIERRHAHVDIADLPVINGDELQLGQLFQNILSNALKFTSAEATPQVKVIYSYLDREALPARIRPTSEAQHFCQISVSDQGVGFDEKYLDRIFQVFQRLHGRDKFPGTGVGLAICQRVAENHGGGITASSTPGQGTMFSIYLPA